MQPDRRRTEGVGLDNVRAGFEIPPVNLIDDRWFRQKEKFDTPLQVFPFPILEARSTVLGFSQLMLLDHGPHRAVEQDDALAHQRFKRMEGFNRHSEEN